MEERRVTVDNINCRAYRHAVQRRRRFRYRWARLGAVLTLVVASVGLPAIAQAAGLPNGYQCQGSSATYIDGNSTANGQEATNISGADAEMTFAGNRYLCTTNGQVNSNDFSAAYVRVEGKNGGFAEVGSILYGSSSCGSYFSIVYNPGDSAPNLTLGDCAPSNGATMYVAQNKVMGPNGHPVELGQVDPQGGGTAVFSYKSVFNPEQTWTLPIQANWVGAAGHPDSNVPGASNMTTHFTDAYMDDYGVLTTHKSYSTCTTGYTEPTINVSPSFWSHRSNSCKDWENWSG